MDKLASGADRTLSGITTTERLCTEIEVVKHPEEECREPTCQPGLVGWH